MQRLLQALAFGSIGVVCFMQGCGDESAPADPTGGGPTASANATNATGYDPICNGGRADGFCNVNGADPETCECTDCLAAAACQSRCVDDGNCNYTEDGTGEDCSCKDCAYKVGNCGMGQGEGEGPGPETSVQGTGGAGAGNGGAGPGPATTDAATDAATTDATTGAATTDAATTDAATTDATTVAGAGGGV